MPSDRASQTIRRRRLAAELRRLRERADLTGDQAAELLGWSGSKISRIETHRIGVKPADLRKLLDLYQVEPAHREQILALLHESAASGWLESATAGLPADYATYLYAEAEADAVWIWDPQIVPGLIQTDAYARHVLAGYQEMFKLPPGDAERRIRIRRRRQTQAIRSPSTAEPVRRRRRIHPVPEVRRPRGDAGAVAPAGRTQRAAQCDAPGSSADRCAPDRHGSLFVPAFRPGS